MLILFFAPLVASAQVGAVTGFCVQGAVSSATSGLPSTNKLQGVIPQCLVTVYLTGTLTKATIYSNSSEGTLTNPFQANINGQWLFYAAFTSPYDVVLSGGYPPNVYTIPVTITGIIANGSSGAVGPGNIPNVPVFNAVNGITTASGVYASYTGAPLNWTDPGLGLGQITSLGFVVNAANTNVDSSSSTSSNGLVEYTWQSLCCGQYTFNGSTGVKSNRAPVWISALYDTVAQQFGMYLNQQFLAPGDGIGYSAVQEQAGGFISNGGEPMEGFRAEQEQFNAGLACSSAGMWGGTTATAVTASVITFGSPLPTCNPTGLHDGSFIRDVSKKISGTYTNATNSGSGPTIVTITGSGFSTLANYSAGGTYTTWNNVATSGNVVTNKALFCPAAAALSALDVCVPVYIMTSDTTISVILCFTGTGCSTPWPWATSGNYTMYTSSYATTTNGSMLAVNSLPANSIGAGDTSGITVGDSIDEVIAYNMDQIAEVLLQSKNDVSRNYGGGIDIENTSAGSSASYNFGVSVSGNYFGGFNCDVSTEASGSVGNCLVIYKRPTSLANIVDAAPASSTPWNQYYIEHLSDGTPRTMLRIDPVPTDIKTLQYANDAWDFDWNGNFTNKGNITSAGVISSPYSSSGPYASTSYDSELSTIASTTYWSTINNSGCTGSPNAFTTLTGNSAAGPYDTGGTTTAPTITTPASFGGTNCNYIGLKQTISMINGSRYTLYAWVKSSSTVNVLINTGDSTCTGCANINTGTGTNLSNGQWFSAEGTYSTSTNQIYFTLTALSTTYSIYAFVCPGNGCPFVATTSTLSSGVGTLINGKAIPLGSENVASSTTPTFSTAYQQSYNVLTANVTTFTLSAGYDGQQKTLVFCQNATGSFTVAAPSNVHGFFIGNSGQVGSTANKCNSQSYSYSALQTAWLANSQGVINQ